MWKILGLQLGWCGHFQRGENVDKEHQLGGNEHGTSMLFVPKSKQQPERESSALVLMPALGIVDVGTINRRLWEWERGDI